MRLRHATPRQKLSGILRAGLLCSHSRGRLPVVWLHTPSKTSGDVLHTFKQNGGRAEAVVVIEAEVPPDWLRQNRKQLWYSRRDIPPNRFRRLIGFHELVGPPPDDEPAPRRRALVPLA